MIIPYQIHYFIIVFLLCYKRYILFWEVRVEDGVTSKLQGLAYHFYAFFENKAKHIVVIHPLISNVL